MPPKVLELPPNTMGTPLSSTAGMFEPIGSAASMEFYMGYECFSEDILCGEGETTAKEWPRFDPEKEPTKTPKPGDPFVPPLGELQAVQKQCDEMQLDIVKHMVGKAKTLSLEAYPTLLAKVKDLGYNEAQLRRTLVYIRDEAPLVVHVTLDQGERLKKMFKDTNYRNQFEVKMSNGSYEEGHSSRKEWEDRLFDTKYRDAKPFQRPKYGTISLFNDPQGERTAHFYGDSYFITKGLRLRCTYTEKDSCYDEVTLACCEHYAHVLARYTNEELKGILQVANLEVPFLSRKVDEYKEIQIHGEFTFADNIQTIVVNPRHKGQDDIIKLLDDFCAKNSCHWVYWDVYEEELKARYEENKAQLEAQLAEERAAASEKQDEDGKPSTSDKKKK